MRSTRAWLLLALLPLAGCRSTADDVFADTPTDELEDVHVRDGAEALRRLLAGNARFVAGRSRHDHESQARRAVLTGGQHPFAVILGCADSRVPPELIFDTGLGDTFVIRVAGNVVGTDEAGSIEYALAHLDIPLVLVLGHEGCGAVTAALEAVNEEPLELRQLLGAIVPVVSGIDGNLPHADRVHRGVEANVRESVRRLGVIADRESMRRPVVFVGAVYELESGRVRVLN